ncbi:hypothetical protein LR48_Vigan09g071100 [Vigna angularis]|uniref:DUF8039 domain-containing protein n=1 Tax=Phaseolus angularis TaxID=3914 RepID=A0A0L9VAW4_PHAAN|nr:hypothetical protein LR48_Vigan09g071100 [Vigna angularis]
MTQGTMGFPTKAPTTPRVSTRGSCSVVDPTEYSDQYELLVDGDPPRVVGVRRVREERQTIHGAPLLPNHVRVTIGEVRDPQAQVFVPTSEIHFVRETIGIFIAWPKALIMSHIATPQFICPHKQPMHEPVIDEDDDMAEVEDDPLTKLITKLSKLSKGPLELYMDTVIVDQGRSSMYGFVEPQTIQPSGNTVSLATDGHHSQTIQNFMVLFVAQEDEKWFEKHACRCFKNTSPISEEIIKKIRQECVAYLLQRWT